MHIFERSHNPVHVHVQKRAHMLICRVCIIGKALNMHYSNNFQIRPFTDIASFTEDESTLNVRQRSDMMRKVKMMQR